MGHFSNGSEGMMYLEQYCMNCRNWHEDENHDEPGCPIWDLHLMHNGLACWQEALDFFIPLSENGLENLQCKMFLSLETPDLPGQLRMFDKE
jgi:hypothetical protein